MIKKLDHDRLVSLENVIFFRRHDAEAATIDEMFSEMERLWRDDGPDRQANYDRFMVDVLGYDPSECKPLHPSLGRPAYHRWDAKIHASVPIEPSDDAAVNLTPR